MDVCWYNQWDVIPVVPKDNFSFRWSGSYGWVLGSFDGEVWKDGSCTIDNTLIGLSKQGDTVELVLDFDCVCQLVLGHHV